MRLFGYNKEICLLFLTLLLMMCSSPGGIDKKANPKVVFVSILPQKYLVERIAGDTCQVEVMIPPGHSPHTYEPTPRQMIGLSKAKRYFRIGYIPFESVWMKKFTDLNPTMKIIDTSLDIQVIRSSDTHELNNETIHDSHEQGIDPHTWLSPQAVKIQLKHILNAFSDFAPEYQKKYQKNYEDFILQIDQLIEHGRTIFAPKKNRIFFVYHPSWAYLARDFNLKQIAIERDGKSPSPKDMKELIEIAKRNQITTVFCQREFDTHNADAFARSITGKVIILDPLAVDWLQNMYLTMNLINKNTH